MISFLYKNFIFYKNTWLIQKKVVLLHPLFRAELWNVDALSHVLKKAIRNEKIV